MIIVAASPRPNERLLDSDKVTPYQLRLKPLGGRNNRRGATIPRTMTNVESIEREVEKLTPEELAAFRAWFVEHDWQAWDHELERDVAAGRLDALAAEALAEYERGETTEL